MSLNARKILLIYAKIENILFNGKTIIKIIYIMKTWIYGQIFKKIVHKIYNINAGNWMFLTNYCSKSIPILAFDF